MRLLDRTERVAYLHALLCNPLPWLVLPYPVRTLAEQILCQDNMEVSLCLISPLYHYTLHALEHADN